MIQEMVAAKKLTGSRFGWHPGLNIQKDVENPWFPNKHVLQLLVYRRVTAWLSQATPLPKGPGVQVGQVIEAATWYNSGC